MAMCRSWTSLPCSSLVGQPYPPLRANRRRGSQTFAACCTGYANLERIAKTKDGRLISFTHTGICICNPLLSLTGQLMIRLPGHI